MNKSKRDCFNQMLKCVWGSFYFVKAKCKSISAELAGFSPSDLLHCCCPLKKENSFAVGAKTLHSWHNI